MSAKKHGGRREGAGRPTKGAEKLVTKSVRLEPDLVSGIEAHAARISAETGLRVSFSDAARILLRSALDGGRRRR